MHGMIVAGVETVRAPSPPGGSVKQKKCSFANGNQDINKNNEKMEKTYTRTFWSRMAFVVLAFLLLAGCQKPEPDPEPPTPPIVNTDTLPVNKFVGTWVLCATNDVNSEPPATCDLADATTDTLVFTDEMQLFLHHGANTFEYGYEYTEHFLIRYENTGDTPEPVGSIQYYFRKNDDELVLRGTFHPIASKKNLCFHRITQN